MDTNSKANPIVQACLQLIQCFCGEGAASDRGERDQGGEIKVFSYRDDFQALWEMPVKVHGQETPQRLFEAKNPLTIVVIWDGMPESEASAGQYVTPFDWAVGLTSSLYEKFDKSSQKKPNLRILILDFYSPTYQNSFGVLTFQTLRSVFPWVQTYQAVGRKHLEHAVLAVADVDEWAHSRQAMATGSFGIDDFVNDLAYDCKSILATWDERDDRERLEEIRACVSLWKSNLLRPGGRHGIANLLGPLVLAYGLPSDLGGRAKSVLENAFPTRQALMILLAQLGLLCPSGDGQLPPKTSPGNHDTAKPQPDEKCSLSIGLEADGGFFGRRSGVRYMLIDDQYELGYHHILGHVIFQADYDSTKPLEESDGWSFRSTLASLQCFSTPAILFSALRGEKQVSNWALPRRLNVDADILLLDLRLWLEEEPERRKAFMLEVVKLCDDLGATAIDDKNFKRALLAAQAWTADQEGSPELPALALFPLLLSHYDPAFPVVLFSSTHQRDVLDLVGDRPNIIATFSKPILSGYGQDLDARRSVADLRLALGQALDLHEARAIWERIANTRWGAPPVYRLNTRWEKGTLVREIFNVAGGSTFAPRLAHDSLRRTLAGLFIDYVLNEAYFDFASQPFDFLEGCLCPPHIARRISDLGFELADKEGKSEKVSIPELEKRRNKMGWALKNIRNRKAHGHAKRPANTEQLEFWRKASILEFHVLLDYIRVEPSKVSRVALNSCLDQYWTTLKTRFQSVLSRLLLARTNPPSVSVLGAIDGFPWLPYTVMAVAEATLASCKGENTMASDFTVNALTRLMVAKC